MVYISKKMLALRWHKCRNEDDIIKFVATSAAAVAAAVGPFLFLPLLLYRFSSTVLVRLQEKIEENNKSK